METAAHKASDNSKGGKAGTRRGTAAPENHKTCNNSCRPAENREMTRTKAICTKGRETKNKRREKDKKAREHTKRIIKGIQEETGKDRTYKEQGKGQKKKGKGDQDQDTGGINGRYSYPLVVPRLGEAPDSSTVVQCTGTERSAAHHHDTMINQTHTQHLKGGDGTQ